MRLVAILLLTLLLAACWTGNALYSDTDARPALAAGIYRMEAGDEIEEVRVSILSTGLTQIESKGEKGVYGFAPLSEGGQAFVAWFKTDDEPGAGEQFYTLVERQPDGRVTFYQPTCGGEEASIARGEGATVDTGMAATCRFPSRASLENAMRQLRPRDYGASMKLTPIGKP